MPSLEWIKITCDLGEKVQTRRLARLLKLKADDVIGKLFRFWVWVEHQSDAGRLSGLVLADIDDVIGKRGFAGALLDVGWLATDDAGGLFVPDFSRHMGAASREREAEADRKRRQRAGHNPDNRQDRDRDTSGTDAGRTPDNGGTSPGQPAGQDRDTSGTGPGPKKEKEKEREEEKPAGGEVEAAKPKLTPRTVPIPHSLDTPEFRAAWADWFADRKARGKAITTRAAELQLAELAPLGSAKAIDCIRRSIRNAWTGLFPPDEPRPPPTAPPSATVYDPPSPRPTAPLTERLIPPKAEVTREPEPAAPTGTPSG